MVRAMTKALGEALLVGSGWTRVTRRAVRHRTMVLAYHNVVPDELAGRGDASLHLPVSRFVQQLEWLSRTCQVVPLADLLRRRFTVWDGERPRVAITFDDAYRGALTLGLDCLTRRGMSATVFVAPGLLDDRTPWWDGLAEGDGGRLDPALRARVLGAGGGDDAARRLSRAGGWPSLPAFLRIATEEEMILAARRPGVRVASHTWGHRNLGALDEEPAVQDLEAARSWLQERVQETYLDVVSYPYGISGPTVRRLASEAGYDAGFSLGGGWVPQELEAERRLGLPRTNVPAGLSPYGLVLRVSRN